MFSDRILWGACVACLVALGALTFVEIVWGVVPIEDDTLAGDD